MQAAKRDDVHLVVVVEDAGPIRPFLAEAPNPLAEAVEWSEGSVLPLEVVTSSPQKEPTTAEDRRGRRFVELPLDGPPGALILALRAIRDHQRQTGCCPVIIKHRDGAPPAPAVVVDVALAGLSPAVDLRVFTWITNEWAWVTTDAGLTRVRRHHEVSGGDADLARLVAGLGQDGGWPRWTKLLQMAAEGRYAIRNDEWHEILLVLYVATCVGCLARANLQAL